jgi:thiol-disulfide isomerase/thioredoxin
MNGEKVSLSDIKGKITVIDFWATCCGPCKAEFPAYKDTYKLIEKYQEKLESNTKLKELLARLEWLSPD